MRPSELSSIVKSEIERAISYRDGVLAPQRKKATKYYRGDLFGNEEDGRSQVVSRDVRDATQEILPDLVEVFLGPEQAVEFVPRGPEDVAVAEQQTDYVNYIVQQDNPGFSILQSALKNALYNKLGAVKWWWDDSIRVTYHEFTGLSEAALGAVMEEDGVEMVALTPKQDEQQVAMVVSQGLPAELVPTFYDVEIKRRTDKGRARFLAIPPEELIFTPDARSEDDVSLIGHICLKSVSELVAMGYEPDMVKDHLHHSTQVGLNSERETRQPYSDIAGGSEAMDKVLYAEVYVEADYDGDDIAELRRICTMGDAYEMVENKPVDEVPIAIACIDPEPHSLVGHDIADQTMDIQLIKSSVTRGILDSLALTLDPRTEAVEGMVNLEDLMNPEVGGVVRVSQVGMLRDRITPFVGKEGLAILAMLDDMRDSRTGQHNMALSADALQSTTASAVSAQVEAAVKRKKLIARTLAETFMKRLYGGLLRLVIKHQDAARMVRLRNEWVEVDPRVWDANMDVTVNVGLGGLTQEKLGVLRETLAFQREVLTSMGPANDAVSLGHVLNTVGKMLALNGEKDTTQFYNSLPLDYRPEMPPPKPDPAEILAQVEVQKSQTDAQVDLLKLKLEQDKLHADILLKAAEINRKYPESDPVNVAHIRETLAADAIT